RRRIDGLDDAETPERAVMADAHVLTYSDDIMIPLDLIVLAVEGGVADAEPVLLDTGHHPPAAALPRGVLGVGIAIATGNEQASWHMHYRCRADPDLVID